MPYWQYQLVLRWYLHQPQSHQVSLQNVVSELDRYRPMDRTPGIPGFDKNNLMCMLQTLIAITMMILMMLIMMIIDGSHCDDNSYLSKIKWPFSNMNPFRTFSHGFQFWEQRSAGQSAVLTLMDLQIETQIGRNWNNSSRHNSAEKYSGKKCSAKRNIPDRSLGAHWAPTSSWRHFG